MRTSLARRCSRPMADHTDSAPVLVARAVCPGAASKGRAPRAGEAAQATYTTCSRWLAPCWQGETQNGEGASMRKPARARRASYAEGPGFPRGSRL